MANSNPTGDRSPITIQMPACHRSFLRFFFTAARDGVREDQVRFPGEDDEQVRRQREASVFGCLLNALDGETLHPDPDLIGVLARIADGHDRETEYPRVVVEHEALHGLLTQICLGLS
jgi:hypothetical protein